MIRLIYSRCYESQCQVRKMFYKLISTSKLKIVQVILKYWNTYGCCCYHDNFLPPGSQETQSSLQHHVQVCLCRTRQYIYSSRLPHPDCFLLRYFCFKKNICLSLSAFYMFTITEQFISNAQHCIVHDETSQGNIRY